MSQHLSKRQQRVQAAKARPQKETEQLRKLERSRVPSKYRRETIIADKETKRLFALKKIGVEV